MEGELLTVVWKLNFFICCLSLQNKSLDFEAELTGSCNEQARSLTMLVREMKRGRMCLAPLVCF